MRLYKTLYKYQKRKAFRKSEDRYFFLANRHLLNEHKHYRFLLYPKDEFDVIRANVVIRSLLNKRVLDEAILYAYRGSHLKTEEVRDFVQERMTGLPYVPLGNLRVYLPIFPRVVNEIYFRNIGKLLSEPYAKLFEDFDGALIDPFEVYGFKLYASLFTKLIPVGGDDKTRAFYHFDFRTLYFLNDQGRLDAKIALFDRFLVHPDQDHILDRLKDVVTAYVNDDREALLSALEKRGFISSKLIARIHKRDHRRAAGRARRSR